MSIKNILGRFRRMTSKQVITAGVFAIAMAGAVGLGLAVKQNTTAATVRECGTNSIDNSTHGGGCGALSASEFISDVNHNQPSDLKTIYSHFGLPASEYDRFLKEARHGVAYKDGRIVVDGQVVAENAWSLGRDSKSYSKPYGINGKTYHASRANNVFAVNTIDVMVLFNANGEMQFAVMEPCGNPTWGDNVKPEYSCDMLTKTPVAGKKDTYTFKASATAKNNASIVRYEFDFGDGTKKSSTSNTIEHTYTKPGKYTATVTVVVKLPGDKEKVVPGPKCKTEVEVLAPYFACVKLMATTNDPKKQKFTITATTNYGNGATLIDADFTFDGNVTVEGVKPNADKKTFTIERTFADGAKHEVVAKINFNVADKVTSVTCKTQFESEKTPVCIVNGKPFPNEQNPYPPEDERCKPPVCIIDGKPFPNETNPYPEGDSRCKKETPVTPAPTLPETGAGSVIGLFAGTSILGAAAHRVFMSRRNARRSAEQTDIDQINSL